jgi:hypothetical protein
MSKYDVLVEAEFTGWVRVVVEADSETEARGQACRDITRRPYEQDWEYDTRPAVWRATEVLCLDEAVEIDPLDAFVQDGPSLWENAS